MRRSLLALLLLGVIAVDPPKADAGATPDLILHDAVVITMNRAAPAATAIAVAGDRIVAVGSDHDVLALAGPSTGGQSTSSPTARQVHRLALALPGIASSTRCRGREDDGWRLEAGWTSVDELFVHQSARRAHGARCRGELRIRAFFNAYLPVNYGPDQDCPGFEHLTPWCRAGSVTCPRERSSSSTVAGPTPTTW
ncbi:MAG: hypothetical protein U0V56_07430 [Actinomycetota bacterium]